MQRNSLVKRSYMSTFSLIRFLCHFDMVQKTSQLYKGYFLQYLRNRASTQKALMILYSLVKMYNWYLILKTFRLVWIFICIHKKMEKKKTLKYSAAHTFRHFTLYFFLYIETAVAWANSWWCAARYGSIDEFSLLPGANMPTQYPFTAVWRGSLSVIQVFTLSPKLAKQVSA